MAFDLEAFKKSVEEPQPDPNAPDVKAAPRADEKWPVRGHIIEQVWENVDPGGTFYFLFLTVVETGEIVPYSLRYGDLPGVPYAEELSRELELGLIEMQYGKPPMATPYEGEPYEETT